MWPKMPFKDHQNSGQILKLQKVVKKVKEAPEKFEILEEQEELLRQRELEEKQLAEKQAVRRYERANVRQNIRDKYKLTKGSLEKAHFSIFLIYSRATDKMIIKNNHERANRAPSIKVSKSLHYNCA